MYRSCTAFERCQFESLLRSSLYNIYGTFDNKRKLTGYFILLISLNMLFNQKDQKCSMIVSATQELNLVT